MKGECSRCKEPLINENASPDVVKTGYGRCRKCENAHAKIKSRTIGGRYTAGRSQAKHNNHNWELSLQQYAAIVSSDQCFYCEKPLPIAAAGLDRKDNGDYTWDTVLPCCSKQPRIPGARGCNETKSYKMAPIILFTWRQFQKYGKLPTEQDFINRIHEFEAERDKVFEVICGLNSNEIKILKRAKSVRESLEKLRKTKPIL